MRLSFHKALLVCFLLTILPLWAEPIMLEHFRVETGDDNTTTCWTKIGLSEAYKGQVLVPLEGLFIAAKSRAVLLESDLLGTGLSLDLNGDGDTSDSFPLENKDGKLSINSVAVVPFENSDGTQESTDAKLYKLAEGAPEFVLYRANSSQISAGITYKNQKCELRSFPNPNFQFLLLEPCDGPGSRPTVELQKRNALALVYEPGLFKQPWMHVQTLIVPIGERVECTVKGKGEVLLMGRVNFDRGDGIRRKTKPIIAPLFWEY